MPEAILKFNLPEEDAEFQTAIKGPNMASMLWNFSQYIRDLLKYGHNFKTTNEALENIQQKFMMN